MATRKRISMSERTEQSEQKKHLPIFQSTEVSSEPELVRRTYYLDGPLIKALELYTVYSNKDKSEIVRDALRAYIPAKYHEMAKDTEE